MARGGKEGGSGAGGRGAGREPLKGLLDLGGQPGHAGAGGLLPRLGQRRAGPADVEGASRLAGEHGAEVGAGPCDQRRAGHVLVDRQGRLEVALGLRPRVRRRPQPPEDASDGAVADEAGAMTSRRRL